MLLIEESDNGSGVIYRDGRIVRLDCYSVRCLSIEAPQVQGRSMPEEVNTQGRASGDRCTAVENRWNNAVYMQRLRREMARARPLPEGEDQTPTPTGPRPTQRQAQHSAERDAAQHARIAERDGRQQARQQAKQQAVEQINAQIDQLLSAVWARQRMVHEAR